MSIRLGICSLFLIAGGLFSGAVAAASITMQSLTAAPVLDGDGADWAHVPATTVALKPSRDGVTTAVESVDIKGGVFGDYVYFFVEWKDSTEDKVHKPWVWDKERGKYRKGPQREDRFALQFAMEGEYSTNWLSGKQFKADMWHWKSVRSNPLGLMHDKTTIISGKKLLEARELPAADGGKVFVARPSDAGDKLYKTKRYHRYEQDVMPKYILARDPQGSAADVKVKGVWSDGKWCLEIKRKMDTGHSDDVVFPASGGTVVGGVAVYDHSGDDDHVISDNLVFQF